MLLMLLACAAAILPQNGEAARREAVHRLNYFQSYETEVDGRQALRIEVNHELEVLERGLEAAIRWLNPGGRVCVISYHSLEDRIVKHLFGEMSQGCTCPPDLPVCVCGHVPIIRVKTRKPLVAGEEELERNPRARSAKTRVAVKLDC